MTETIEKLVEPIAGDNPCGESARYEPEYEAVDKEIAKLNSIDGTAIDWSEISHLTSKILVEKSKDLVIATYYAFSQLKVARFSGLSQALGVIDLLIDKYWEDLYPEKKRMRGRIAAVTWMSEQLDKELANLKPSASDADAIKSGLDTLNAIQAKLIEKLADTAPDLSNLIALYNNYANEFDRDKREKEKKQKEAEQKKAQGLIDINNESDVGKVHKQIRLLLAQVAEYARKTKLTDPRAFRMSRQAAWLQLDSTPTDTNGVTQIPAVAPGLKTKYDAMLTGKEYLNLVNDIEEKIPLIPFWLDAHRYCAIALGGLGEEYVKAREIVISELATMLTRLPKLRELRFADGTPYASEQTQQWLDEEVLVAVAAEAKATESGGVPAWEATLKEAKVAAAKGKFSEGLALIKHGALAAEAGREQFMWRFTQALYSYEVGHIEVTISQLEYLDKELLGKQLHDWEPAIETQVVKLLLQAYDQLVEKKPATLAGVMGQVEPLYKRMCRLDLDFALKIGESKGLKRIITRMFEIDRR